MDSKRLITAGEKVEPAADTYRTSSGQGGHMTSGTNAERGTYSDRLLGKWAVEERTSLDITTVYRKMKEGTFPQPVRVGRRRVAWRESDIAVWQKGLAVGVRRE
jgi:prophage regulatory protein